MKRCLIINEKTFLFVSDAQYTKPLVAVAPRKKLKKVAGLCLLTYHKSKDVGNTRALKVWDTSYITRTKLWKSWLVMKEVNSQIKTTKSKRHWKSFEIQRFVIRNVDSGRWAKISIEGQHITNLIISTKILPARGNKKKELPTRIV